MRREADKAEQGENKLKGKRRQNGGAPPGVKMITKITKEEYLRDPCAASSLPFRKTEQITLPGNVSVFREDEFSGADGGTDEPYFKLIHHLENVRRPGLPGGCELTAAGPEELAAHINECYEKEGVTAGELASYRTGSSYDESLWIAVRERATGRIIASGIGGFDPRIGEGFLDWIQVSPDKRRQGLGRFIVCELLARLSEKADFATVSGRLNDPGDPFALYLACGFVHPVIWHVVRR